MFVCVFVCARVNEKHFARARVNRDLSRSIIIQTATVDSENPLFFSSIDLNVSFDRSRVKETTYEMPVSVRTQALT